MSEARAESVAKANLPKRLRRALRRNAFADVAMSSTLLHNAVFLARAARISRHPVRLLADQLSGPAVVSVTIRETGSRVFLRRLSDDLVIYHQIIGADMYRPPTEALHSLSSLGRSPRIADLGANIGMFSVNAMKRYPGARILAVEPDPQNAALFQRTIAANFWQDRIELIPAAAGNKNEPISFSEGGFHNSRVEMLDPGAPTRGNSTVDGVDILPLLVDQDILKIDIEGSEWQILQDPRFARLPLRVVTMEWHSYGCPHNDPRLFAQQLLEDAGFVVRHDQFATNDCGTLWAWQDKA